MMLTHDSSTYSSSSAPKSINKLIQARLLSTSVSVPAAAPSSAPPADIATECNADMKWEDRSRIFTASGMQPYLPEEKVSKRMSSVSYGVTVLRCQKVRCQVSV